MTRELQPRLEASAIAWPALRNHIPCMAHVIQPASGAFMSTFGENGSTKSWKAHAGDHRCGENESTDIGKSVGLRKDHNATINKASATRQGFAKIIEKVRSTWYFESSEIDLHRAENTAELIIPTTGHRNEFIDCQKTKVDIPVLPVMDMKTHWNPTQESLESAYRLR